MSEVSVKMIGTQRYADGETGEIISDVLAEATTRGDKHYIRYCDQVLVEGGAVRTTIKITNDALTVLRRGDIEATMHYAAGHSQEILYETPQGVFPMRHDTKSIAIDYDGAEGSIEVVYDTYVNRAFQGENLLRIEIKRRT